MSGLLPIGELAELTNFSFANMAGSNISQTQAIFVPL
jgi:hypothetical protein